MQNVSLSVIALSLVSTIARAQAVKGVVVDAADHPIAGVQLVLLDTASTVGARALSDERGEYQLTAPGAGLYRLRATRIGYKPFVSGARMLAVGETTSARVRLADLPFALDTVAVGASANTDANDIRRTGLGHIVSREYIAQHENEPLADVLSHTPGIKIFRGKNGHAWVTSSRGGMNPFDPIVPTQPDLWEGAKAGPCYALIYLDGALVYGGTKDTPLFDINSIAATTIDAIEYYAGPAQTPAQYMRTNSSCGVVLIHTRH